MISSRTFYDALVSRGIDFFAGVPDSLLKDLCAYITDHTEPARNIITANEGGAVALAAGYHLATGRIGMVYLQNSGLGNVINPLLSLIDVEVYNIPVLFVIGWRGEPGKKDEPQHVSQGKRTLSILDALGVPSVVVDADTSDIAGVLDAAADVLRTERRPFALVVRDGAFEPYSLKTVVKTAYPLNREQALHTVVQRIMPPSIVVSTTGKTSRELFELREKFSHGHAQDFLTVGSMGHASMIALGIALQQPRKTVYCIDGDGACLMHMGGMAIIGAQRPDNLIHIVINNGAHDSVGGQPTVGFGIELRTVAAACGYRHIHSAETPEEIAGVMERIAADPGPAFFEIRVNKGARAELGRPTTTPVENKQHFMEYVSR